MLTLQEPINSCMVKPSPALHFLSFHAQIRHAIEVKRDGVSCRLCPSAVFLPLYLSTHSCYMPASYVISLISLHGLGYHGNGRLPSLSFSFQWCLETVDAARQANIQSKYKERWIDSKEEKERGSYERKRERDG